jgi:hypothetical protein
VPGGSILERVAWDERAVAATLRRKQQGYGIGKVQSAGIDLAAIFY